MSIILFTPKASRPELREHLRLHVLIAPSFLAPNFSPNNAAAASSPSVLLLTQALIRRAQWRRLRWPAARNRISANRSRLALVMSFFSPLHLHRAIYPQFSSLSQIESNLLSLSSLSLSLVRSICTHMCPLHSFFFFSFSFIHCAGRKRQTYYTRGERCARFHEGVIERMCARLYGEARTSRRALVNCDACQFIRILSPRRSYIAALPIVAVHTRLGFPLRFSVYRFLTRSESSGLPCPYRYSLGKLRCDVNKKIESFIGSDYR